MKTRLKLLGLLTASTSVVMFRDIRLIGFLFTATVTLFFAGSQRYQLQKRLIPLLTISLLVIGFQLVFNQTASLSMRMNAGVMTGVKIMTLSLMVFLFSLTTSPSNLIHAFSFLPYTLRLTLTISLSLLPILINEMSMVKRAQQARGHSSSFAHPFASIMPVIVPLLHRTLRRAEHIAMVLETRGLESP